MNTPSPPPAPTVASQMQNQNTPFGSLNYSPNSSGGYTSNLTPSGPVGSVINNNLSAAAAETPPNINNTIQQGTQLATQFEQPFFNQQQSNLNSQLQNEGFAPGDAAAQLQQRNLQNQQDAFVGNAAAQFAPIAMQEYQAPIQAALGAGGAVNSSLTPNQVQPAVQTQTGAQQFNYGQQIANQSAMLGGLFSIPSAALGGWAKNGFSLGGAGAAAGGGGSSIATSLGLGSGISDADLLASLALV